LLPFEARYKGKKFYFNFQNIVKKFLSSFILFCKSSQLRLS
jgi:hypothetical protein